ncbi:hypothetical protein LTS10_011073 [Elasticomyces elasticus]|nr:hypothetical protein LTS10_011073 [Elasticomyces elasticus]
MALLVNQVSANRAIITSVNEHGLYDVSLNITHIDLMPGLGSWDDLAFTTLQNPWFSESDATMTSPERYDDKAKRFLYIGRFVNKGWVKSGIHLAKVSALGALADTIEGSVATIIQLERKSICAKNGQGDQGCISWSGQTEAIKKGIALTIIENAKGKENWTCWASGKRVGYDDGLNGVAVVISSAKEVIEKLIAGVQNVMFG